MVFIANKSNSIANQFVAELRNVHTQTDRMRFRRNLERMGEILAYEISKTFDYSAAEVETPLGVSEESLPNNEVVVASILRAGLPLHHGFLNYLDHADNAFVAAYRREHKDGTFDIALEYASTPNLDDKTLILCDPMIATGASIEIAMETLQQHGTPAQVHIAAVIASTLGLEAVQREFPEAHIWLGALDDELTAKSYIVPGLGDAGDLAFGEKH